MVAVSSQAISTVTGYKVEKGQFNQITPNLPQKIAILGQGNSSNEADYDENEKREFISAKEVGERYGFGSPLYNMMRILRPLSGGGVGTVKTVVIPQKEAASATKKSLNIEATGTASGNATHTLVINGRRGIDAARYDYVVEQGDGPTEISQKQVDVISNALAAPCTATQDTSETATESCLAETKWAGIDANEFNIDVDTNGQDVGVTYSINEVQAGAGVPDVTAALQKFEDDWITIVCNPYGTDVHTDLESFNGRPDPDQPSGRYLGTVFKPFVALYGDTSSDITTDFSGQKEEVTNCVCPAPNSGAFGHEVAAAYSRLLGLQAQEQPHLDIMNRIVPDVPVADSAGKFADYSYRDQKVKEGISTAVINAGNYVVKDFVTTYHPDGEIPLQFNFVRNLIIDWNIRFRYYLLEQDNVVGHTIVGNDDIVDAKKVVKPKQWNSVIRGFAEDLGEDGLIADVGFMEDNIEVSISDTNPDRFQTQFKYKRSGFGRISATVAVAGFNLG